MRSSCTVRGPDYPKGFNRASLLRKERNFVLWVIATLGMVMAVVTLVLTQWQAMPPFLKGTSEEIKKSLDEAQKDAKELNNLLDEAKQNQGGEAGKQREHNKKALEDQAKTIQALQAANERLQQRLDSLEKQVPPRPKDK